MKGLENAIRNLNSLDTRMVPQASAWAINRVAQKAVSVATRQVAGNTVAGDNQVKGIPLKLVRQRVRVFKASPSGKMTARIRVNRGNLPAIKLGTARVRLTRRGGKLQYRGSVLKVGKYLFRDAFIQQLANGRWHVLRRLPEARFATGHDHQGRPRKNRLPVEVVKIPLSGPLTQAFEDARDRIIVAEMPKQLGYALKQQLRLWLTR
ncbi:phage tail protein [Escherichia coli]|nr:phage tail protein [Escherichia coli]HCT7660709.1 phage tail protein [Escherichia coli]